MTIDDEHIPIDTWKKIAKASNVAHFDRRISIEKAHKLIRTPNFVKRYSFYPFLKYEQFVRKGKVRPICYSAHIDRYIYKYYSYLIEQKYNGYLEAHNISDVAVAYRAVKACSSNICIAKKAFDFMRANECYIMICDFKGFFDNLDHAYLKDKLKKVLDVTRLNDDYFAVYKNITKYSTFNRSKILKIRGLENTDKGIATLNMLPQLLSKDEFKKYKSKYIKPNPNTYGIPQGSSISAVLSNVYMIDVDEKINDCVITNNGLYLRYSDDFIVIIPTNDHSVFNIVKNKINQIIKGTAGLTLEPKKTKTYHFKENSLIDLESSVNKKLEYLGFEFNGESVSIKEKSLNKYLDKLNKALRVIVKRKGFTKNGNIISCKKLYRRYSQKGARGGKANNEKVLHQDGNFITYVRRVKKVFYNEKGTAHILKKHMKIINKTLGAVSNLKRKK